MKYIKVYMGGRATEMPLEDYLEIMAYSYGYESYAQMKERNGGDLVIKDELIIERED